MAGSATNPEEPGAGNSSTLTSLVLAPFGRDAELLSEELAACGSRPVVCEDVDELLARIETRRVDVIVVSDAAFSDREDDRVLSALRQRPSEDLLPVLLLTGSTPMTHPITRLPGVLIVQRPMARRIFASAARAALATRRRVLALLASREKLERRAHELEQLTDSLRERNAELKEAREAQDRFVAMVSHELRTPLTAIMGCAELLDSGIGGTLTDSQREYVSRIDTSAGQLRDLINDILDLAKAEAGSLNVVSNPFDIAELVGATIPTIETQARSKGLDVDVVWPDGSLPCAKGDENRTRQILLNLLSNAVKFTQAGGVTVRVARPENGAIAVQVEDTGPGLTSDQLSRVFDEFYQTDAAATREHGGTGLGLAISKRLARLMEGDIAVESTPDEGSTFTLSLPTAEPRGDGPADGENGNDTERLDERRTDPNDLSVSRSSNQRPG